MLMIIIINVCIVSDAIKNKIYVQLKCWVQTRALQWSGNPYGNGYGLEMDGNGAQFVKRLWIGLDLGDGHHLKTIQ